MSDNYKGTSQCSPSACDSCSANCSSRQGSVGKNSFAVAPHKDSHVKKVIAVISGKGGVGKSMVSSALAMTALKDGKSVGIMDADITGPSIPKMFSLHDNAVVDENAVYPAVTPEGLKIISMNLLVEHETDPVIWRGPVIAGTVSQFWSEVAWGDLDYLFIDMPPGTGDVPLTVFQSLPVDGIILVTSPQDLVSMIVEKAINMANAMDIPILGLVENMSYFICPNCKEKHYIFGQSNLEAIASQHEIANYVRLPMEPQRAKLCDEGKAQEMDTTLLEPIYRAVQTALVQK